MARNSRRTHRASDMESDPMARLIDRNAANRLPDLNMTAAVRYGYDEMNWEEEEGYYDEEFADDEGSEAFYNNNDDEDYDNYDDYGDARDSILWLIRRYSAYYLAKARDHLNPYLVGVFLLGLLFSVLLGVICQRAGLLGGRDLATTQQHLGLDFSKEMTPLWDDYRDILTDAEYETWFDGVDAATKIIDEMVDAVPKNKYPPLSVSALRDQVNERAAALKRAATEFDQFVGARAAMVRRMLRKSEFRPRSVDGKVLDGFSDSPKGVSGLRYLELGLGRTSEEEEEEKKSSSKNDAPPINTTETLSLLADTAYRLVQSISQLQTDLWKPEDIDWDHGSVANAVSAAAKAERAFIGALTRMSTKGHLWTAGASADTMRTLEEKVDLLGKQYVRMQGRVDRIRDAFDAQYRSAQDKIHAASVHNDDSSRSSTTAATTTTTTTDVEDNEYLLAWGKLVADLLESWVTLSLDTQEGLLISMRKSEIQALSTAEEGKQQQQPTRSASWDQWKRRNCGGTSCYDAEGGGGWSLPGRGRSSGTGTGTGTGTGK
ncbi:hypothetical protein F4778DRAFT_759614, partial [Xylariomycetidae sp. FL2044]